MDLPRTIAVAPNRGRQFLTEYADGTLGLRSGPESGDNNPTIFILDPRTLGKHLVAIADRLDAARAETAPDQ